MSWKIFICNGFIPPLKYLFSIFYPARGHKPDRFSAKLHGNLFHLIIAGQHAHAMTGIYSDHTLALLFDDVTHQAGRIVRIDITVFSSIDNNHTLCNCSGFLDAFYQPAFKLMNILVKAGGSKKNMGSIQKSGIDKIVDFRTQCSACHDSGFFKWLFFQNTSWWFNWILKFKK